MGEGWAGGRFLVAIMHELTIPPILVELRMQLLGAKAEAIDPSNHLEIKHAHTHSKCRPTKSQALGLSLKHLASISSSQA